MICHTFAAFAFSWARLVGACAFVVAFVHAKRLAFYEDLSREELDEDVVAQDFAESDFAVEFVTA